MAKKNEADYRTKKKVYFTPRIADDILWLKKQCYKNEEICEKLDIPLTTLRWWLCYSDRSKFLPTDHDCEDMRRLLAEIKKSIEENNEAFWDYIGLKIIEYMSQGLNQTECAAKFKVNLSTYRIWLKKEQIKPYFELGETQYEAFWTGKGRDNLNEKSFQTGTYAFSVKNRSRHFVSGDVWTDRLEVDGEIKTNQNELLALKATQERMLRIQMQEKLRQLQSDGVITVNEPDKLELIEHKEEDGSAPSDGERVDTPESE